MQLHFPETDLRYFDLHHNGTNNMQKTKAFRNGDYQAVCIPAELAYDCTDIELEIERVGHELRIRPARRPLSGVLKKFARFDPDFMEEARGGQEQAEREEQAESLAMNAAISLTASSAAGDQTTRVPT